MTQFTVTLLRIYPLCLGLWYATPARADFAAAERALNENVVKTSENLQGFNLSEEERFALAWQAARHTGAVFTPLIPYYRLQSERDRYNLAMRAAAFNTCITCRFDVPAFELATYEWRLGVIKASLQSSFLHLDELGAWELSREDSIGVFLHAARFHGTRVKDFWHLIPNIQEHEIRDILLAAAESSHSANPGEDLAAKFDAAWLETEAYRVELARTLSAKVSNFLPHIHRFNIASGKSYDDIVQLNLTVPRTTALLYPESLRLSDQALFNAYMTLRDRDSNGAPVPGERDIYFIDFHDPILLLETLGRFKFPEFKRPGLRNPWADDTGTPTAIEDHHSDDVRALAAKRPKILPPSWVDAAFGHYASRIMGKELLRQCYRLSTTTKRFEPRDSLHIVLEASGLNGLAWDLSDYEPAAARDLHVELLSLMHHMPQPLFHGIDVDPKLYGPAHIRTFLSFLKTLSQRIHWRSRQNQRLEWDAWLRLRDRLRLPENGINLANIYEMIALTRMRPPLKTDGLPSCQGAFSRRNHKPAQ